MMPGRRHPVDHADVATSNIVRKAATMHLTRAPQSANVTRYWVVAHIGPYTSVQLRDPTGGISHAEWRTGEHSEIVRGVWLSTNPNLEAVVVGHEHAFGPADA